MIIREKLGSSSLSMNLAVPLDYNFSLSFVLHKISYAR